MKIRKGQSPGKLTREVFGERFRLSFADPHFDAERGSIARLEQLAWENYTESRKAPLRRPAGPGFADPAYELSLEWLETRSRLQLASERFADPASPSRVLVVNASARNDGTCPGENSKSYRLAQLVQQTLEREHGVEVDALDLSLLSSEYGRTIHPCKACLSTAMPLCHWPCSCYPNHSLGQTGDWMAELYERWTLAHGVVLVTPVYWYQAPSGLKLMIDRLVCADGGNPDPSSTQGKDPARAKALESKGWGYPQHLAGRVFGLAVHGDVAGVEGLRRSLTDWLEGMGLRDARAKAKLDRYIGYYEPYATSHDALDHDHAVQQEVVNVAHAVGEAVRLLRAGSLPSPDGGLRTPRPK